MLFLGFYIIPFAFFLKFFCWLHSRKALFEFFENIFPLWHMSCSNIINMLGKISIQAKIHIHTVVAQLLKYKTNTSISSHCQTNTLVHTELKNGKSLSNTYTYTYVCLLARGCIRTKCIANMLQFFRSIRGNLSDWGDDVGISNFRRFFMFPWI